MTLSRAFARFALLILASLYFATAASALEAIKISREDNALDLTGALEITRNQGDNFQVSTVDARRWAASMAAFEIAR